MKLIVTSLVVLALAQLGVTGYLVVKIDSLHSSFNHPAQSAVENTLEPADPQKNEPEQSDQAGLLLGENQIRRIIREELRAQIPVTSEPEENAVDDPDPILEADRQYETYLVEQEIEYFISVGKITDQEMLGLQAAIARLGRDEQEVMLRRLVQAMNTGELEGRL